jgi:geranylgeranyl diphosphate synthase type I
MIVAARSATPCDTAAVTRDLRSRIDETLVAFLEERRRSIEGMDPTPTSLVDEVLRLLAAGGGRIRPAFCIGGYRSAGGGDDEEPDAPIVRAAAALELLHTMALIHDDLIDGAKERRGVPTTGVWFSDRAEELGVRGDPDAFGLATAILVGDVAAVWADLLFLTSGFPADVLARALADYHEMRERMAAGQYLDVTGAAGDPVVARRAAALKGGSYTVEGPLLIGAALAGGSDAVRACLSGFGRPLGEAFQLRDDLRDGAAGPAITGRTVEDLIAEAKGRLDPRVLPADEIEALERLADLVAP